MSRRDGCARTEGRRSSSERKEDSLTPPSPPSLTPVGRRELLHSPRQSQKHSACIPHQSSTIGAVWTPASSLQRELVGAGPSSGGSAPVEVDSRSCTHRRSIAPPEELHLCQMVAAPLSGSSGGPAVWTGGSQWLQECSSWSSSRWIVWCRSSTAQRLRGGV